MKARLSVKFHPRDKHTTGQKDKRTCFRLLCLCLFVSLFVSVEFDTNPFCQNTLPQRSLAFTCCASQNVSPSNWQLWRVDPSTAPCRPTYSRVSPVVPTWHPDDVCGHLPHIVWTFSLQSAGGRFRFLVPPSGTTCLSTSHLRRHSRFSDNDSCFMFSRSYQDTIIWLVCCYHHSSLLSGHL